MIESVGFHDRGHFVAHLHHAALHRPPDRALSDALHRTVCRDRGCHEVTPAAPLHGRLVTPADIVELRALDIERNEQRAEALRAKAPTLRDFVKRLWPFRWPTQTPAPTIAAEPPPVALPDKGRYIDVVI